MPEVEGVNVPVQFAVPGVVLAARVQVVNVPVTPETANVTGPVGVMTVPAVELSATVAVHEEPWLITTGVVQATEVVVVRRLTGTLTAVLALPL